MSVYSVGGVFAISIIKKNINVLDEYQPGLKSTYKKSPVAKQQLQFEGKTRENLNTNTHMEKKSLLKIEY